MTSSAAAVTELRRSARASQTRSDADFSEEHPRSATARAVTKAIATAGTVVARGTPTVEVPSVAADGVVDGDGIRSP